MNPNTDHLQMIGPWGWLGWTLAVIVGLLFYRQWTSDPQTALRNMRVELDKARATIAELRALEKTLTARNEELNVQVNSLQVDNHKLHQAMALLKQANELQGETITRMERHQKELTEKYEHMFARVVQLEARLDPLKP